MVPTKPNFIKKVNNIRDLNAFLMAAQKIGTPTLMTAQVWQAEDAWSPLPPPFSSLVTHLFIHAFICGLSLVSSWPGIQQSMAQRVTEAAVTAVLVFKEMLQNFSCLVFAVGLILLWRGAVPASGSDRLFLAYSGSWFCFTVTAKVYKIHNEFPFCIYFGTGNRTPLFK